jgi:hypothetical protein
MELVRTNNGRFAPGSSGNPSGLPGRPVGSRTAFSQGFFRDLADVWQAEGKEAMLKVAKSQPATFMGIAARLVPSEVALLLDCIKSLA